MSLAATLRPGPFRADPGCEICGAADVLGIGTCAACASADADALLFLEPFDRRADRETVAAWLADSLAGRIGRGEAREAVRGTRPIVRIPTEAAGRAAGMLSARGVAATAVSPDHAWRRLPIGFLLLLAAVVGAGLYAGLTTTPLIGGVSVAFAGLLALSALRALREPVWLPEAVPVAGMPEGCEGFVRATLNRLAPGRARDYLRDLVALSAGLSDPVGSPDSQVLEALEEMLRLACGAATDLSHLDASLSVLERRVDADPIDVSIAEAVALASEARALLVQRFEESVASLGRLQAATVDAPARLVELAGRLAEDAERRAEARETVRRLTA